MSQDTKSKHILHVDDDLVQHDLICRWLASLPVALTSAISGKVALQKLNEKVPDLILVDHGLPDMNGFELIEKIQTIQGLSQIPIFMVTALVAPSHSEMAQKMEVALFEKPMGKAEFANTIEKAIKNALFSEKCAA